MSLFGIDIAGLVYGAMDGQLRPVTLHKITSTLDAYGAPVATAVDHAGQGVRLQWETKLALARGYPLNAAKILMLQTDTPSPSEADEVTIEGQRYRVKDVRQDPAGATWTMAGVAI